MTVSTSSYHWASQVAFTIAFGLFAFVGTTFNFVTLGRVLHSVGGAWLARPLSAMFNAVWFLAIWSFVRARYSDPGILPEKWQAFVERAGPALPIAPPRREWQPRKTTMCAKCRFPRPERSHHCLLCGRCVLRYDHHCPWINNCVGFYNHKFFLQVCIYTWLTGFIAVATTVPTLPLCVRALLNGEVDTAFSFNHWTQQGQRLNISDVFGTLALASVGFFALSLLTAILRSHGVLAMRNLTSVEDFYDNMPNPFDQGSIVANLAQVFGEPGVDWILPVHPRKPLSDGVTFPCGPGDLCDGLLGGVSSRLEVPVSRGLLACGGPSSRAPEELRFERDGTPEFDDGPGELLLPPSGCGQCPKTGDLASTAIDDTEELWMQRYGLDERRRAAAASRWLPELDLDGASNGPTLLKGLWSSFWRGRKTPRQRAIWL